MLSKEVPSGLNENFQKFFSMQPTALVQIEQISSLLKQASKLSISENDTLFNQLKKKHQTSLMLQLRTKEFLASNKKSYSEIKSIMGELLTSGVIFIETNLLKDLMDLNRRLEVTLSGNSDLDLGKLQELSVQVEKNRENLDLSFTEIIKEKIG